MYLHLEALLLNYLELQMFINVDAKKEFFIFKCDFIDNLR